MILKYLDARELGEKVRAHSYLSKVFTLPEYYGMNLDALYDCLSELDGLQLIIHHCSESGEYLERISQVLEDVAEHVEYED